MENIIALIGWVGLIEVFVFYTLSLLGVLKANQKRYHVLNAMGCGMYVIYNFSLRPLPYANIIPNAVFTLISIVMIIILLITKTK